MNEKNPMSFVTFYILTLVAFLAGFVWSKYLTKPKLPTKDYPIEVSIYYSEGGYSYSNTIDADSVRHDTIWNNGLYITNKNIKNVIFK
jgi:hypothetical protein